MRTFLLASIVLCLLIVSGCQTALDCQDPLGCARFERDQPIKVGIVTPRTDSQSCPTAAEAVSAIQTVLSEQDITGRLITVIVEDSLSDPIVAQQRLNDLAEDPATVGLFYLDCVSDPVQVAQTAANAGIPGFVHQLPEERAGLYPILPPTQVQSDRLVWLLSAEVDGPLLVAVDPLDGPEVLSQQICERWQALKGSCTIETFTNDLATGREQTDALLVLSSRADILAGSADFSPAETTIYWFDPLFSQSPSTIYQPENGDLFGVNRRIEPAPKYQSTWFAVQAAGSLLKAIRTVANENYGRLYLPRQAMLDELDRLVFPDCQSEDDPACPTSFDYTLYPFREGILIINP